MLILEGAQAGLSWEIILKKRDAYREVFKGFNVVDVANMSDEELANLVNDARIVRNKTKIMATRLNAQIFRLIQEEYGSFDKYIWNYVNNTPIVNHPKSLTEVPSKSSLSDEISKDLKKRGMKFVGSVIIYSYLQAVGLIDDHEDTCWKKTTK